MWSRGRFRNIIDHLATRRPFAFGSTARAKRLYPIIPIVAFWAATNHLGPMEALGHDIPNARVDRSIQVSLEPGRVKIDYEVSLSELTLTQELRQLIGSLPGSERRDWFHAYGRVTGPLNAKGLLVRAAEAPIKLESLGFDLVVQEHPRFTFHFAGVIPSAGKFSLRDTNFVSSEGTSRLALRSHGVKVTGDRLPADVEQIEARPVWQLDNAQERRTHEILVDYAPAEVATEQKAKSLEHHDLGSQGGSKPEPLTRLSRLLDRSDNLPIGLLGLGALVLGAFHSLQPGHGKTLVAVIALDSHGAWWRGILVGVITTITHFSSVFLVAAVLWWTRTLMFGVVHQGLTRVSGFLIATIGVWKLGRHLGGYSEHDQKHGANLGVARHSPGLLSLGMAGGLVPCWDAVGLMVLAASLGQFARGLFLVFAFSLGMGLVLIAVGGSVGHVRKWLPTDEAGSTPVWEHRLGIASGLLLSLIGGFLLFS